jgi:hypothetical protein
MNIKLFLCRFHIPGWYKRRKLAALFEVTADAFAGKQMRPGARGYRSLLSDYAVYTRTGAARALENPESLSTIKSRLYHGAYRLGAELRRELGIKTRGDFQTAVRAVYKALEIDLSCDQAGGFTVRKCFFSRYYSGAVCAIVAALDRGLVAGLSNGGQMDFSERITENSPCCRGRITI